MKIKSEMFREYDIRGVYGEDLNAEVAYLITYCFVHCRLQFMGKGFSETCFLKSIFAWDLHFCKFLIYLLSSAGKNRILQLFQPDTCLNF